MTAVGCTIADYVELAEQLDDVSAVEHEQWITYRVAGRTYGYLWPRTSTLGLRQTIAEQEALVAERPGVFEKQFTSAGFGWVVVHLAGVERDELAELVFEAWRLTAPADVVEGRGERLPV
ncbi:MmcQ/YjbR family DNA-binding protein [Nocardioides mangrovicus]|uniref:MmcQ/YjbR family DNA-binding protein n=1 Tax=Nocardioides mangrovicus TaxID=2478913 RepID=A0A3L8P1J6_9ACTN|nr:MmcQ/YjbR family DNA-binding protein [Nocardioides mangrovicus]RLV49246.1 MmcQ/YjbR family DNA-binding protein [Nocardioides mangrovicus]